MRETNASILSLLHAVFSDLIVNSFNFIICMVKKKFKDRSGIIMQNFRPDPKS